MSYIYFNRHSTATSDGWVWECFVLPDGEISGEVHHFTTKRHEVFHRLMSPKFFVALDRLLGQFPIRGDVAETRGMVIVRLLDGKKTYYSLLPINDCPGQSTERKIWKLVNSIFKGTDYMT